MQQSHDEGDALLTALQVQQLLRIDRSTVYRMAEDGRLPAIRVGRSWRFPAGPIETLRRPAEATAAADAASPSPAAHPDRPSPATDPDRPAAIDLRDEPAPAVDPRVATAAVEVAADLLGVMMVVTDMRGEPVTDVANPCPWFERNRDQPSVLDTCIAEWRDLADHPDLAPRFQEGALGFQCARAFIRQGTTLVGMVLAGGVSPSMVPGADPELHHLDQAQRARVLATLPRIAATISTQAPRPAATPLKED